MRSFIKILVLSLVSIIGFSSAVFGGVISKTFEIGEGTSQPFSHKRTFEVPCNLAITALVTYSRLGRPGTDKDVPLTITIMQPAADGGEGEIVGTKQVTANTSLNSITLGNKFKSPLGCNKTWSVRVRADEGSNAFTVKGEIRFTFDNGFKHMDFKNFMGNNNGVTIRSGNTDEFEIRFDESNSASTENSQGIMEITGLWDHNLGLMPIKMKAEIINPRGEVVGSATGFAQNEINPCCSGQKLKLVYRIPEYIQGTWKVKLKNLTEHDSVHVKLRGKFTPSCP